MNDTSAGEWSEFARELGRKLRSARETKNLSQEQVSSVAGVGLVTYRKYEDGELEPGKPTNPTSHTLAALATALDVELFGLLPSRGAERR